MSADLIAERNYYREAYRQAISDRDHYQAIIESLRQLLIAKRPDLMGYDLRSAVQKLIEDNKRYVEQLFHLDMAQSEKKEEVCQH